MFCSSAPHTQHSSLRLPTSLLSLFASLVLTRLDYGSVTLNGITKRLMDCLQSVLNAAARLVHNSRKYDRISPLLRDLQSLNASLNSSSFVWPFLCSAVATRLHRTTWRETNSGQTRTTRGDDCDRRQLRSCSSIWTIIRLTTDLVTCP